MPSPAVEVTAAALVTTMSPLVELALMPSPAALITPPALLVTVRAPVVEMPTMPRPADDVTAAELVAVTALEVPWAYRLSLVVVTAPVLLIVEVPPPKACEMMP